MAETDEALEGPFHGNLEDVKLYRRAQTHLDFVVTNLAACRLDKRLKSLLQHKRLDAIMAIETAGSILPPPSLSLKPTLILGLFPCFLPFAHLGQQVLQRI